MTPVGRALGYALFMVFLLACMGLAGWIEGGCK